MILVGVYNKSIQFKNAFEYLIGFRDGTKHMRIKLTTDMQVQPQDFVQALQQNNTEFNFTGLKENRIEYTVLNKEFVVS